MIVQCLVSFPKGKFVKNSKKPLKKQKINFSHSALFDMKTGVSFKDFVSKFL